MRPKNERQRLIVDLSAGLPPLTEAQRRWAIGHCFTRRAFVCRGKAWCSVCGGEFDVDVPELSEAIGVDKQTVCPHCQTKLKYETSRRGKLEEKVYYTVITTCRDYQVIRHFIASKYIRRGGAPYHDIREAVQNWIDETGHEEVIARSIVAMPQCYYDKWNFSKPMELRDTRRRLSEYPYRHDKYKIDGTWIYPSRNLLPKVKRNGYTGRNTHLPESEHIKLLLTDREAEMLEKNGQYALLGFKYNRGVKEFCMPYAHAIRIANRNRYRIKDATLWMDYLHLLSYFHLDTHNAYYVCPANLKAAHDRLHRRKERMEAKQREEERIREAAKWEAKYRETKGKYFGVCFGNANLTISVITSVAEIAEEGKTMHHCVYTAGYYKRPDSLILSARDKDGKRVETIEVNLKTFKIVQSRAKCNGVSPYHDEILKLVEENINTLQKIA